MHRTSDPSSAGQKPAGLADQHAELEPLAPGVRVERRLVLSGLAAAALLAACAPRRARATAAAALSARGAQSAGNAQDPMAPPPAAVGGDPPASVLAAGGPLAWDEFLAHAPELAGLAAGTSPAAQDSYLYSLAARAARLGPVPAGKLSPFADLDPRALFGLIHRGSPFFVVQWRLEPFAVLPPHVHPGTSVCTLATEGEAEIRHYDVDPAAPAYDSGSSAPFRLRETRRQLLLPGRISTLSATRDNVHRFAAGAAGAAGIDITTMHGGDGSFSFIALDADRPVDAGRGIFEGVWTGNRP